MQYLKDTKINGPKRHVSSLLKLFGMTAISTKIYDPGAIEFTLTHVFANSVYGGVSLSENKPTIMREPLYVLVPNTELDAVWAPSMRIQPCTDVEVRFGPASQVGNIYICDAVSIRIERCVLYLCLDPKGRLVDKSSNMGV
jgi:hypothetical protein